MQILSQGEIKENNGKALTVATDIPAIARGYKLYKAIGLQFSIFLILYFITEKFFFPFLLTSKKTFVFP